MRPFFKAILKGSAIFALPLLLAGALQGANGMPAFSGSNPYGASSTGGLEGSWMSLSINRDQFNDASAQAGFPGTSASIMQLWGTGVMLQKGPARYGAVGMTGSLSSDQGGNFVNWGLDLAGFMAEQRYPGNGWEVTAGFFAGLGQFTADYRSSAYTRFESRFIASGATAGVRWPTDARLSFFLRSGYLWLPASGAWHGDLAAKMAKTYFDLSAPFAQVGMDLMF